MSITNFTPGPWDVRGHWGTYIFCIHDREGKSVTLGEQEANIRLVGAAPDLYAALAHTEGALTALIKDVEAMTDWTHHSLGIERKAVFAKILSEARAALAKAGAP